MLRAASLAVGLVGAAGLSQFPEYAQQYTQRLAGAVDELSRFVAEFDVDAEALGLGREAALAQLAQGSDMGVRRATTMERTIARHEALSADLGALREAGPFTRAYRAGRFTDAEIARAALADFRPALPLTFEGAVFGGTGFIGALVLMGALRAFLRALFRGRRPARA